jgi:ATP-binding cassette subfamily B protein
VRFDQIATRLDPALRRRIALVPQEAVIFAASVRENIGFREPQATDGEVERAEIASAPGCQTAAGFARD